MLMFRKTHQTGSIKPFYLIRDVLNPHLCVVLNFFRYLEVAKIRDGLLFRTISARGALSPTKLSARSVGNYMYCLMEQCGIDPSPFGSHSMRRGGCQYLVSERRFDICEVIDFGGWSGALENNTILRYLNGQLDVPRRTRLEYLRPRVEESIRCSYCGRNCTCI
jgi:hypothetical protein